MTTHARRPHLATVVEFSLDLEPTTTPRGDLGDRARRVRLLLGIAGASVGLAAAVAIGTGAGAPPASAPRPSSTAAPLATECRGGAVASPRHDDPHLRCIPVLPHLGARAVPPVADQARPRVRGPGVGTHRRWPPADEPAPPPSPLTR
jgi:hypothetical protein